MITILFHMRVKAGREEEFARTAARLTESTHAEDDGCLAYAFYRRADDPRQAVLYEQWRDPGALDAPMPRLRTFLDPPAEGGRVPATPNTLLRPACASSASTSPSRFDQRRPSASCQVARNTPLKRSSRRACASTLSSRSSTRRSRPERISRATCSRRRGSIVDCQPRPVECQE